MGESLVSWEENWNNLDKAAAHISEEVLQHAEELGIVIELVFAGMTSGMQHATFGSIEV